MELTCETIASACRPSGLASKAMLLPVSRVQGTMKCVLIEYIFTQPAGLNFVSGSALRPRYVSVERTSSKNCFSWLVRRAQSAGSCMIVSCLGPSSSASCFASSRRSHGGHTGVPLVSSFTLLACTEDVKWKSWIGHSTLCTQLHSTEPKFKPISQN